jgi:hypothetical protein
MSSLNLNPVPRPMSSIIAEYAGTEHERMAQMAATGVRVLSLDGGGVKGLSSAHIIAALESRPQQHAALSLL